MRRFAWRLQRVLDIKAKQEQIKTQELFVITDKLTQARSSLLAQQQILRDILESIANEDPKKRLDKQEFFLRNSATTDELIKKLKTNICELEIKQKEKVAEVLKLRRFKESLERLREQAQRKYIEAQEKLEQKQFDETATLRFTRERCSIEPGTNIKQESDLSVSLQENQK
jgi:flagellar biosynthesis chaperone FliJ